jgi:abequosyltransferase
MDKILTVAIPTYNRSKCICEQLERLNKLDEWAKSSIDIFVSDNCSPDDTQEKVLAFKKQGLDFEYSRNEKNLGPDINFEICYRHARTPYVWLLGDDDFVLPEKLAALIRFLKENVDKNYGLVYVNLSGKIEEQSTEYIDSNKMIQDIGIMSTFISSNVVHTRFVKNYDFNKYIGSFFIQVPLELQAALSSEKNAIINLHLFGGGDIHNENGGYNIFKVFVVNLLTMYREAMSYGLSSDTYLSMKSSILSFLLPYIDRLLLRKNRTRFKTEEGWQICFRYFGCIRFLTVLTKYKLRQHMPARVITVIAKLKK